MTMDIVDQFKKNTANHAMTVKHDSGLHRHLRFDKDGSGIYHFEIITWPGYLCICGDMGCYVFRRLPDMFEFFRGDRGINPSYWAEKCTSESRFGDGIKQYSQAKFAETIKRWFDESDEPTGEAARSALWAAIEDEVLSAGEFEAEARHAADDFDHEGFQFRDFWETNLTEYTFNFLWCLHAIVFAIQAYDKSKADVKVAA